VRGLAGSGVGRGYHAEVDPARLVFPMQAVIRIVVTNADACQTIGARLRHVPEVVECRRVTGSDSHILRAIVRSVDHLDELLTRIMPHSGDTITAIVLSTPVAHRPITREMAGAAGSVGVADRKAS